MTTGAWIMLVLTWGVICYFTGRFFHMVLTTPPKPDGDDEKGA